MPASIPEQAPKMVAVYLRIGEDLREQVKEIAAVERRSAARQFDLILRLGVAEYRRLNPKKKGKARTPRAIP